MNGEKVQNFAALVVPAAEWDVRSICRWLYPSHASRAAVFGEAIESFGEQSPILTAFGEWTILFDNFLVGEGFADNLEAEHVTEHVSSCWHFQLFTGGFQYAHTEKKKYVRRVYGFLSEEAERFHDQHPGFAMGRMLPEEVRVLSCLERRMATPDLLQFWETYPVAYDTYQQWSEAPATGRVVRPAEASRIRDLVAPAIVIGLMSEVIGVDITSQAFRNAPCFRLEQ